MRVFIFFLSLLLMPASSVRAERLLMLLGRRDGLAEHSIEHDGLERWFLEHQPKDFASNSPLVLVLHGGGGSMRQLFRRRQEGKNRRWLDLSEDHGFLLIAPNGIRISRRSGKKNTKGNTQNWNDLRKTELPRSQEDDVGFITSVVEWAIAERQVDPARIYVTGVSNGGMMTQRLIIERPDVFAAGASFIGNLPAENIELSNPTPPVFLMNGTKDPIIPWEGGTVGPSDGSVRSALDTRDYFVQVNQAGPEPITTNLPDTNTDDECVISSEFYAGSETGGDVQFLTMVGGGHHYPSTQSTRCIFGIFCFLNRRGPECLDASGADLAYEFMSLYRKE